MRRVGAETNIEPLCSCSLRAAGVKRSEFLVFCHIRRDPHQRLRWLKIYWKNTEYEAKSGPRLTIHQFVTETASIELDLLFAIPNALLALARS